MFIAGKDGLRHAQMNGSNYAVVDKGYLVTGVTLDPDSELLYWADHNGQRIVKSRGGTGQQTIV